MNETLAAVIPLRSWSVSQKVKANRLNPCIVTRFPRLSVLLQYHDLNLYSEKVLYSS